MKVTNWRKRIIAAVVAAGIFVPGVARAVSIPLSDPNFDAYTVPTYVPPTGGFAYAAPPPAGVGYRPTSGWVDDLDSPTGYTQDDSESNWLYNSAYGEDGPPFRGAPRSGNQAMHGLRHYNAQETSAVFEAEKFYSLSLWAQGDHDASATSSGVFLYIFRGDVDFTDTSPLKQKLFTQGAGDFNNRTPGMTQGQSQVNWKKITITHAVYPDSPEINAQVGVGFFIRDDGAVEDATLDVDDAANHLMILEVNTTNGQVRVRNQTGAGININYYDIKSASGALNATAWNSLQEQNLAGFPAGNGSGNGWEQAGGSNSTAVGESFLTGNSTVGNSVNVGLGAAFNVGGTHDLVFQYGALFTPAVHPTGDYNDNGVVDAADYVVWRDKLGQDVVIPNDSSSGTVMQVDYTVWRSHFGDTSTTPPSTLLRGLVHYVTSFSGSGLGGGAGVPEPSSVILVGLGMAAVLVGGRRREGDRHILLRRLRKMSQSPRYDS